MIGDFFYNELITSWLLSEMKQKDGIIGVGTWWCWVSKGDSVGNQW